MATMNLSQADLLNIMGQYDSEGGRALSPELMQWLSTLPQSRQPRMDGSGEDTIYQFDRYDNEIGSAPIGPDGKPLWEPAEGWGGGMQSLRNATMVLGGTAALGNLAMPYLGGSAAGSGAALGGTEAAALAAAENGIIGSTVGMAPGTAAAYGTGAAASGALLNPATYAAPAAAAATAGAAAAPSIMDTVQQAVRAGASSEAVQNLIRSLTGGAANAVQGAAGDAARLAMLAQQWREANGQAKDLEGQAREALDLQGSQLNDGIARANRLGDGASAQQSTLASALQAQLARNTGMQDQLGGRAINAVDNIGSFDPTGQLRQTMDATNSRATDQYGRAINSDPGLDEISRLNALAATRERERVDAYGRLQGSIGSAGERMDNLYSALGSRQMYGEGDVDRVATDFFNDRSAGVDRALRIASSQGFAGAMRNGLENSTQAELVRDDLTRRFSDVYSNMDAQSRVDAGNYVNNLSNLQGTQRTASISELGQVLSPELQARMQTYRPDDSALNAANTSAAFDAANANNQRNFYNQLATNGTQNSQLWSQGGNAAATQRTQAANTLLNSLAQQGQLANSGMNVQSSNVNSLMNAFSNLNRDNTVQGNSRATNFTNMAQAGRTAAGGANNRLFEAGFQNFGSALNGAASGAANSFADILRGAFNGGNSGGGNSTNPFNNTDTNDYSYVDPFLRPGSI